MKEKTGKKIRVRVLRNQGRWERNGAFAIAFLFMAIVIWIFWNFPGERGENYFNLFFYGFIMPVYLGTLSWRLFVERKWRRRVAAHMCSYCREAFSAGEEVTICAGCRTAVHDACVQELRAQSDVEWEVALRRGDWHRPTNPDCPVYGCGPMDPLPGKIKRIPQRD